MSDLDPKLAFSYAERLEMVLGSPFRVHEQKRRFTRGESLTDHYRIEVPGLGDRAAIWFNHGAQRWTVRWVEWVTDDKLYVHSKNATGLAQREESFDSFDEAALFLRTTLLAIDARGKLGAPS